MVKGFFAREVIQVLFIFRLLDPYFGSTSRNVLFILPSFVLPYLTQRVMNEPDQGLPGLKCVRSVAERLYPERSEALERLDFRQYVEYLCRAIVNTGWFSVAKVFKLYDPIDDLDPHLYVAAVYTQTMPFLRRWHAEGNEYMLSSIFGNPQRHIVNNCNHEVIELFLCEPDGTIHPKRRLHLMRNMMKKGHVETMRFIHNFKIQQFPWTFEGIERKVWQSFTLVTPNREAWNYVADLRRTYQLIERDLGPEKYTESLSRCAEKGWADMVVYLADLGAYINGEKSDDDDDSIPLAVACKNGHLNVVEVLLARGATTSGAVEAASQQGHITLTRILLQYKADTGRALDAAVAGGYRDIVELLLDHGDNANTVSSDSLVKIIDLEHSALLLLLLERGLQLGQDAGRKCVRQAKEKGLESMLTLLNENGVDVAAIDITQL